jgi:hypothetical protein
MTDSELTRHLGRLGFSLPTHTEKEWKDIFFYFEFFLTINNKDYIFNWEKIMDTLLGKVK